LLQNPKTPLNLLIFLQFNLARTSIELSLNQLLGDFHH